MTDIEKVRADQSIHHSPDHLPNHSPGELEARSELDALRNGSDEHDSKSPRLELTEAEKRKILWKVDIRLIPLLTFLYLIAFIDRTNIGNAKIAGLTDDLHMHGMQYNAAVTLFFVPYTLLEVPCNIVLKLMRPSRWISILLFSWGLVMTLMGLIESYSGLLAARWFLGVAEAGFFPAATFLLTLWYTRYEYQRRFSVFYAAASMAGAFSGLLAFVIEKMDGVAGRSGWQWIFILEGLVPVAVSFLLWTILPDSPNTCRFLANKEQEFLVNRIAVETGSDKGHVTNSDKINWQYIKAGLSEWKLWAFVIVYWGNSVGTYGFSATVPTVIEELGYSSANAQLLTVPIYFFAVCFVIINAFLSDHYKKRWMFILVGYVTAACGFIAQLAIPHPRYPGVTYGFLFPVAAGMYGGFPPLVSWVANNVAPSSKRAVGMALVISVGNMGAIMGSNIYLAREAPKYSTGFGISLATLLLAIVAVMVLRSAFLRENRKREELISEIGEAGMHAKYTEQELIEMGDRSPFFRYAI